MPLAMWGLWGWTESSRTLRKVEDLLADVLFWKLPREGERKVKVAENSGRWVLGLTTSHWDTVEHDRPHGAWTSEFFRRARRWIHARERRWGNVIRFLYLPSYPLANIHPITSWLIFHPFWGTSSIPKVCKDICQGEDRSTGCSSMLNMGQVF